TSAVPTQACPICALIATAILGKYRVCWTEAKLSAAKGEASKVGVSMLPRGEFSFIVASEGAVLGVASQILYPVAGLTTLVSSFLSSIGMRLLKARAAKATEVPVAVKARRAEKTA